MLHQVKEFHEQRSSAGVHCRKFVTFVCVLHYYCQQFPKAFTSYLLNKEVIELFDPQVVTAVQVVGFLMLMLDLLCIIENAVFERDCFSSLQKVQIGLFGCVA